MASVASASEPDIEPTEVKSPELHVPTSAATVARAPRMDEETFGSWGAFFEYLDAYQHKTHQIFKKRTSTSAKARNADLRDRGKDTPQTIVPDAFDKYYRKLVCTHSWSRPSRSKGKRHNYFVKSTGCQAQMTVVVMWDAAQGFHVKVTHQETAHNHSLSSGSYGNHPSNRRVADEDVIDFVDELQAAGAKKKLILQYLRKKTGKHVTLRDVHNLVAKLKEARRGATTVEARLESGLRDFCSRKGNTATIYVDDEKLAQTITFQTHQMRRFFEAFPQVLMVDATHNTNDARYKLFSFMIHDVFGHGQYVQHALMENESADCLGDAVKSFKSFNSTWDQVRVIIVDKDFGEIALLQEAFPAARILLCVFHVVKYLRGEMAKREYNIEDRDKVEDAVHMMVNAKTELEYETSRRYLYYVVDGKQITLEEDIPEGSTHPFLKYFHENWHNCRHMWSGFGRVDVPHLGNTTNNRLEAAWGHLKDVLKSTMALDECIDTLQFLQSIAEMEYAKKMTDVGHMRYAGADAELTKLSKEVSQHAYELVEKQYRIANDRKTTYTTRELQPHMIEMVSAVDTSRKYHLDTRTYHCSCNFMRTELLPCRHAIYWRLLRGKCPIPVKHIHPRWSLSSPLNIPVEEDEDAEDGEATCGSFRVRDSALTAVRHKVLNGTNKFRTSHAVATRIADIMSRNGTPVFIQMLESLKRFESIATDGVVPFVSVWQEQLSQLDPLSQISEIHDGGAANSDDTSEAPTAIADATTYDNEDEKQREDDLEEPNDALDRGGPTVAQSPSHSRDVSPCSSHTGHTIEVTHSNSHSGGTNHSEEVTSDAQGLPAQSEMRDERSIVGLSRSSLDETKQVAPPAKRALSDGGQPSSSSSEECSFFVSKSTKTRGRPKIRKNQKQQVKKQRMVNSLKEAKQLVQGTLTPVITLSNVARVLKSTYSYESAYEFLSKISVKTMGPRKKVIAKMVAPSEALSSVKFVFTEQFTHKCRKLLETYREALPDPKSPVGVRLAKIGVISEDQLKVMVEYHHTMKSLEAVSDTIEWMAATSLNRLDIPEGLNEYVELDKTKASTALQQIVLPISRLTPFGMVSNESVLLLREDLWLNDDCMMHVMTSIQEEHANVGIISPGVTGTDDPETQEKIISGSDPFQEHNTHVLLPIHINRNHWCGAVFDFKSTPNRITVFDPQQKAKQLETCEDIVKKIFPEIVARMDWKREVRLKQADGHSCGPLVLLFFESIVRDVVLPKSPSKALLRYYRMRYLLKSLHV